MMGAEKQKREQPIHPVTIDYPFYMGKYQITQGEWKRLMNSNTSHFKGDSQLPVQNVSWFDAQDFIKRLNQLNDGYEYRLPSESEWEYACRAGTTSEYAGELFQMAWFFENSSQQIKQLGTSMGLYERYPHKVGTKSPNAWGLYDMHGNVYEWVEDIISESYHELPNDGSANTKTGNINSRILRGGSAESDFYTCRSAYRNSTSPDKREDYIGFRVMALPKNT